jgi:MFS family permease
MSQTSDKISVPDSREKSHISAPTHLERVASKDPLQRNELGRDAGELQGYWKSPRLIGSLAAGVLLANSIYIGYAMPVNILSVINADIGPSPNIYLVSLMYTLFAGVLNLFFARISDILGRRYFLVGGQLFGTVGSIVCATGNTVDVLIAGSVLAGIGGAVALLYPVIIHELIPNKYRHWGQAAVTLSVLPTLGFGPAIARSMVANTVLGWRNVYWLNVAVSGSSAVLFFTCYFPPNFHMINSELTKLQEVKALDYGGLLLYFGGLILVLLGFTWAQGTYAWSSAHVVASLVVGVVTLIAFALYETYAPLQQPLLPVRLFKLRNITACVFVGSAMQTVWLLLNVFWPMQISVLFTSNEVSIGLLSCTTGIALTMGELIFAPLFKRVGLLKWQMVIASAITAVFATAMAAVTYKSEDLGIASTTLAGLAVGWIELVTIVITGLVAPPNDIGVAQGFFGSTRLVFGTVAGQHGVPPLKTDC